MVGPESNFLEHHIFFRSHSFVEKPDEIPAIPAAIFLLPSVGLTSALVVRLINAIQLLTDID